MCYHRKSLFQCNHSQLAPEPLIVCQAQRDHLSGAAAEPCGRAESHARSTIRLAKPCPRCRGKKATTDRQLALVKARMADLRRHLDETYGDCMKHLDEAGLEPEARPGGDGDEDEDDDGGDEDDGTAAGRTRHNAKKTRSSRGREKKEAAAAAAAAGENEGDGEGDGKAVDPVEEFLKKKMKEDHSHLMMLCG